MNKAQLVEVTANKVGFSKRETEAVMDAAIEAVTEALVSGDKVQLAGFGTFEVKRRAARSGRNPKTNEPMEIPAKNAAVFKAGSKLKSAVAG